MLNDDQRVTEMASLCGGVYVMSAFRHWRHLERASVRDQYLLAQEPAVSTGYRIDSRKHAQEFVDMAFQRNRCDEFKGKEKLQFEKETRLSPKELLDYKKCAGAYGCSPSPNECPESVYRQLLECLIQASARAQALQHVITTVHKDKQKGPSTKVVVFAEAGTALAAASAALQKGGIAFTELPQEPERQGSIVGAFARADVTVEDHARPRVLLLTFEQAVGLNLQYSCCHCVLYAPLWGQDPVLSCAQEQQAIGRLHRPGQEHDVHVYRLMVVGPQGEELVDHGVFRRNTSEALIKQATSD